MDEIQVAAGEQHKITELRMEKMMQSPPVESGVDNSVPAVPITGRTDTALEQSHGLSGEFCWGQEIPTERQKGGGFGYKDRRGGVRVVPLYTCA